MIAFSFRTLLAHPSLVVACFLLVSQGLSAKPPTNTDAKSIANKVPKFKPGGNEQTAQKQMAHMVQLLAGAGRRSASANTALVEKALDYRDDMGGREKLVSTSSIVRAWEAAYDYGAIVDKKYTGRITKGRYEGEKLVWESIVPKEVYPEAVGYIGNIRLVPEPIARQEGASITGRDQAFANTLKGVLNEAAARHRMLELDRTSLAGLPKYHPKVAAKRQKDDEALWKQQIEEVGDVSDKTPRVRLEGQRMSTPSKMNDHVYELRIEVSNTSGFPTEIEIESAIIGYTEKNNHLYDLKRHKQTVRLLRSQVFEYSITTPNVSVFRYKLQGIDPWPLIKGKIQPQPIIYRGYTIVARHKGEVIGAVGSDGRMAKVVTGEYAAPANVLKGK